MNFYKNYQYSSNLFFLTLSILAVLEYICRKIIYFCICLYQIFLKSQLLLISQKVQSEFIQFYSQLDNLDSNSFIKVSCEGSVMERDPTSIGPYCVHRKIGQGGQAKVYLVSKQSQLFAAKLYASCPTKNQFFQRESHFLQKINCEHMIKIVESISKAEVSFDDQEIQYRNAIILEYASFGQIYQLVANEGAFTPSTCNFIFQQLLSTVKALKKLGICHRDLKLDNLLLDEDYNIKLVDFGLSTFIEGEFGDQVLTSKVGTQGFKSPEMERGQYNGHKSDIFALGVILFVLYSGSPPFLSTKFSDKIYKIIREGNYQKFWNLHEKRKGEGYYSKEFKNLLNRFFSLDPQKRPTLQELQQIEWLLHKPENERAAKTELSEKIVRSIKDDSSRRELQELIRKIKQGFLDRKNSIQTCIEA